MFSIKDKEESRMIDIYFSMQTSIIAGCMYANAKYWKEFKENLQECLRVFLSMDIVDVEQTMLLWCYRNYPQNYNVLRCYKWFDSLLYFVPQDLRENLSVKSKGAYYYKEIKEKLKLALKEKRYIEGLKLALKYCFFKFIYKKKQKI